MVFIVHSNDFEVELYNYSRQRTRKVSAKGFPTFYSSKGQYIYPVNLWLNYLVNVRNDKDINSNVRALKRYWKFLEKHELEWNHFPTSKMLKPTYRFRNDDLLYSARRGDIQFSTASIYINHVVKFYEWAASEKLITFSGENSPFEFEAVKVQNKGALRHINSHFIVRTTDLRIKKPARNEEQQLNPLSEDELLAMGKTLSGFSEEFIIHQLLQLQSGLRVSEASTFPMNLTFNPSPNRTRYEVEIGPHAGVHTKYGKIRKIEINSNLMKRMYLYSISERRSKRASKIVQENKKFEPLLLNQRGLPLTSNNIQQYFRRLRISIRENYSLPFNHRTHDLRATYGTYRLASLLSELQPDEAMALIMGWMGHKNEKTTWMYLRYLNKDKLHQQAIFMLDQLLDEAISEGL
ncbi:tyrosine-type recombinase/integrase [Aliikangiella sp. IMCC44359]|uniref:tyrosine-type recombinase/integrase n=1 Tax=Aliikangiella sp. IMCC44359 TaxID=3459125 RepID=UPI00403AB08B